MTGMSQTASTTKAPGDVELRIMPTMTSGNTTYNAMAYCGVEVVSSNPEVAAVKLTNGHQDIVIGKWQGGDWNGADCLLPLPGGIRTRSAADSARGQRLQERLHQVRSV